MITFTVHSDAQAPPVAPGPATAQDHYRDPHPQQIGWLGGGHRDHGDGQHQPALRAGETHREVEILRRLELGEGLLAELHGTSLTWVNCAT